MSTHDPVAALENATDFSVLIAWKGAEDKPFYKALLVSPSRSSEVGNKSFWGYAVISREEFGKVVAVLRNSQEGLSSGGYDGEGPEYYVEIEAGDSKSHCSLGFEQETVKILNEVADALEASNRKPVRDVINRISPFFGGTSS